MLEIHPANMYPILDEYIYVYYDFSARLGVNSEGVDHL